MSFCQAMLQNRANLMVQSIVPSANTNATHTSTNKIGNIRTQCGSFIGTPGNNAPEESKHHFVNINYVIDKRKLIHGEDQIYSHKNELKASSR